nr:hypothetical protein [Tanacetum cinerariifolium]
MPLTLEMPDVLLTLLCRPMHPGYAHTSRGCPAYSWPRLSSSSSCGSLTDLKPIRRSRKSSSLMRRHVRLGNKSRIWDKRVIEGEMGDGGVGVTLPSSKGLISSLDGKAGSGIAGVEAAEAGISFSCLVIGYALESQERRLGRAVHALETVEPQMARTRTRTHAPNQCQMVVH